MNTRSALTIKIRTIKRLNEELANGELTETEIEDLHELTDEMRDLAEEYVKELGAEELVKRVGWNHWLITNDGIEEADASIVLAGLEELLGTG